jgi:release factor glutamine methyltransferase
MATTSQLVRDAAESLAPFGILAIEVDVRRAAAVAELAASHGAYVDVRILLDLTGRERFVVARRREE